MKLTRKTLLLLAVALITAISAILILKLPPAKPAGGEAHAEEHGHGGNEKKADEHATEESPAEHQAEAADAHAEHEEHGGEHVEMSDAAIKSAGIQLVKAGPATLSGEQLLPGEIRFNEDRLSHVTARLAGVVSSVHTNLGAKVKKGQLLAVIESQVLAELRSDYLAAIKRKELAQSTFDREKKLWEAKISPEQDFFSARKDLAEAEIVVRSLKDRLSAIGAGVSGAGNLARFELRAPQDGLVMEKHITPGEAVKEDADLLVIADLSTVWAEITVYPANLNQIHIGQNVRIHSTELNHEARGQVAYIGSLVGEQTRSAKARVTLSNPEGRWRPGLFVNVALAEGQYPAKMVLPVSSLHTYEEKTVVFVREGDAFEVQPVKIGRKDQQSVEILEGLDPGALVAATNSFIVKAELGKASAEHEH